MRGIAIREELTDEWHKRGVKEQREYEILTAEISKFIENRKVANRGGNIAGNARKKTEKLK